jgi:iron complex outermembrane receptor protein
MTLTFFNSRIDDAVKVDRDTVYVLRNIDKTTNAGIEVLATVRLEPLAVTGTYTYVRPREYERGAFEDAPLTPRHSAGMVGMWEEEDVGRVGVELYFTGEQRLEANPFADVSEPYLILGVLGERQFGRLSVFVNGENLTGVRQTKWHPLERPARGADGRRTVDAWAPLEGRNINGGVRVRF